MDAWAVQARPKEIPVLFSVPLGYRRSESVPELDVTLGLDPEDMSRGTLRIEWGPHRLESAFDIAVPSPTFYRARTEP